MEIGLRTREEDRVQGLQATDIVQHNLQDFSIIPDVPLAQLVCGSTRPELVDEHQQVMPDSGIEQDALPQSICGGSL